MYCSVCGTQLADSAGFCPECGKPAGAAALAPSEGRIAGHVRVVGILWLALSAFRILPGVFLMLFFWPGLAFLPAEVPRFVFGLLPIIGGLLLLSAALGIVTGWGLLVRAPWARMLAIVAACLNLLDIPLGTALGVYTLWVLVPAHSEREYRSAARAAS